jgi:hypothetical protein
MKMFFAYCWRNGRIGMGYAVPERAIPIASGRRKHVRSIINAWGRLSRLDNKTLFVPGVPEAGDENRALEAASRFSKAVRERLEEKEAA